LTREEGDGRIKVSLRSKTEADVSKIAKAFGGGGHRRAAGFTVSNMERDEVVQKLLKMIEEELKK